MSDVLDILGLQDDDLCDLSKGSITEAGLEMKDIFQERLPYTVALMLDGACYVWGDAFITNCVNAMSTDNLVELTAEERTVWYSYVAWCDHHTDSADTDNEADAIGCTIPDANGISYIVLSDGTITTTLCDEPLYDISKADLYKSLDNVFMAMLNCEEVNQCVRGTGEDVESILPCSI